MKQKLTLWAICCLMVFLLPSCTKNKMKDLLAHIPEDAEVVFVADLSTMLESAGGNIENEKNQAASLHHRPDAGRYVQAHRQCQ